MTWIGGYAVQSSVMEKVDTAAIAPTNGLQQTLLFWLGAPVFMGMITSLSPSELSLTSRAVLLFYSCGASIFVWFLFHISTIALARYGIPASWRTRYSNVVLGLGVLACGCLIGTALSLSIRPMRADIYCALASMVGDPCYYPKPLSSSWDVIGQVTRLATISMPFWLVTNAMIALLFSVDRYGFTLFERRAALQQTRPVVDPISPLLSRLPFELGTDVIALEGKQHYVEVHTRKGSALILYRLSDAMRELSDHGQQIHRSYWIAYSAVDCIQKDKGTYRVVLSPALSFPVSRAFTYVLKTDPLKKFIQ